MLDGQLCGGGINQKIKYLKFCSLYSFINSFDGIN